MKKLSLALVLVSGLATLLGSADTRNLEPPEERERRILADLATIRVNDDPFRPEIAYLSGTWQTGGMKGNCDLDRWVLVGNRNRRTNEVRFYVQWAKGYCGTASHFFHQAGGSDATELRVSNVKSEVQWCVGETCGFEEWLNIYFNEDQIRAARSTGLSYKVYARDGISVRGHVPAVVVDAMLRAILPPVGDQSATSGGGKNPQ